MGRALKKGLDYVSLDVNFFHDIKVRKLIKYKGITAPMVYQILLCEICRQGYYLPWDDDMPFLISETSGISENEVKDIIDLCLKVGLFDFTLYNRYKILTSSEIQDNYFYICYQAKRKIVYNKEYLLVKVKTSKGNASHSYITSEENPITSEEKPITSEEKPITSEEKPITSEEKPITSEEKPITSEEKFSSKRKTIKKETSLFPSPYTLKEKNKKKKNPPTTTTARMREGGNSERGDETLKRQELTMPVSQGVAELLQDSTWLSNVQKLFNISSGGVTTWLQVFSTECACRDNEIHESLSDIKRHFVDWLKKKDLSKESALSALSLSQFAQASQYSTSDTRKMTGAQKKWETLKKYLSANVEKSDQPLVAQLEFGGFYPAFNKLVIKVPTNEIVDRLEQKYANQLKTAITYEYGKPHVEYYIMQ